MFERPQPPPLGLAAVRRGSGLHPLCGRLLSPGRNPGRAAKHSLAPTDCAARPAAGVCAGDAGAAVGGAARADGAAHAAGPFPPPSLLRWAVPGCAPGPAPLPSAGAQPRAARARRRATSATRRWGWAATQQTCWWHWWSRWGRNTASTAPRSRAAAAAARSASWGPLTRIPQSVRWSASMSAAPVRHQRPLARRSGFTGLLLAPLLGGRRRFWARAGPLWGRAAIPSL